MPSDAAPSDRDVLADCKDSGRDTRAACRGGDTAAALFDPAATPYLEEEELRRTHLVPRHLTKDNTGLTKAPGVQVAQVCSSKGHIFTSASPKAAVPGKAQLPFPSLGNKYGKGTFLVQLWVCVLFALPRCPQGGCWL